MRTLIIAAAVLLAVPGTRAAAQQPNDREQVRAAVLDYVEGFYQGDSTRLVRSVSPEVRKNGYWRANPDSAFRASAMPYPAFMRFAAGGRAGRNLPPANAPKEIEIFDVQDQTASAKLTAWWGTDYLLLGRENGRWMITHVLWQSPPRTESTSR
jgi:hypothetical protein